jgi:hypothetical protein
MAAPSAASPGAALGQRLRQRRQQARVRVGEVGAAIVAQQDDRAPCTGVADKRGAQLVPEPVGLAQLAMPGAAIEAPAGGGAQASRARPRARDP